MKKCSFIGYSELLDDETKIIEAVRKHIAALIQNYNVSIFHSAGYGRFDDLCVGMVKELKNIYPEIKLYLISTDYNVTPDREKVRLYDGAFFPSMEYDMKKAGAAHLKKFMVDKADYIIAYIKKQKDWVCQALEHAEKQGKTMIYI